MSHRFNCRAPIDTLGRVLDTARRLGLDFNELQLERIDDERFRLCFALAQREGRGADVFAARIGLISDLAPEPCHG